MLFGRGRLRKAIFWQSFFACNLNRYLYDRFFSKPKIL